MKAIILAAGKGTRLNGSELKPKCLFEVGGRTFLHWQMSALRAAQIKDIVVVLGFEADRIKQACKQTASFVMNERFEETSSLYSLWLAREHLVDGFVVLNCDVLFHPALLTKLVRSPFADALLVGLVDRETNNLGDEEMKVRIENDLVVDISKDINPGDADGENVGIVKFGSKGAKRLVEKMNTLISAGKVREWAPRAFRDYAAEFPLHTISTDDYPWIEIDFPEDYLKAQQQIFPRICAMADSISE